MKKLNINQISLLIIEAEDNARKTKQRFGQSLWNTAEKKHPELFPLGIARENFKPEQDCFYNDDNITNFINAITEEI